MKNTVLLNIGLAVGHIESATEQLDPLTVLHAIGDHIPATQVKEWHVRVHPLTGEKTLVIRLVTAINGPYTLEPCIYDLCKATRQDCIAGKLLTVVDGTPCNHEFLTGPKAAEYGGAFDPTYWLDVTCDNAPKPAAETLANLMTEHTFGNWKLTGFVNDGDGDFVCFEHESGRSGNAYLEIADEGVTLADYDGTVALPLAVITMLRQVGVEVDREFE
jgi:hypothetical protein